MKRAALSILAATLAATALGSVALTATAPPTLTESKTANFPEKAYVLAFAAKTTLKPGQVAVRENGTEVSGPTVLPANAAGAQGIGTVLLIDASNSMKGKPIEAATVAARTFVKRAPGQPIAIVTFNNRTRVALAFTVDQQTIETALASTPPLAEGTHIYDGVATAVQQIRDAKLGAGRIVLLSDGADVGSTASIDDAKKALDDSGVRLYSVGLNSPAYNPVPLQELAAASEGQSAEASSTKDLNAIYAELGTKASNEYLVSYRSLLGPDTAVKVKIAVAGYPPLSTSYATPALAPAKPYAESAWNRALRSPITMLIVVIGVIALLGAAIAQFFQARRDRNLRKRLGQFVTIPADEESRQRKEDVHRMLSVASDRSFKEGGFLSRFAEDCEVADVKMAPTHIVYFTIAGTVLIAFILSVIPGKPIFALFALLLPVAVRSAIRRKLGRKRKTFGEQLPDNLDVLASALRAGHSLAGSLAVVVDDADEPSRSEFRRVVADEQLGIPLDEALEVVVKRMDNTDLDQVAILAGLQRETGGNMAEVLDRIVDNVRSRMEIRRLIQTLTAQGRMARWIVSFLPLLLLIVIAVINPSYLQPLFHNPAGTFALVLATIMVITGSLIIKKIIEIKV